MMTPMQPPGVTDWGAIPVIERTNEPLVSVVIPVRDRPEELARALRSVVAQTYSKLEILVIENNSSDPEAVKRVAESFATAGVSYLQLMPCDNANVARNFGVANSNGSLVAFLDSDDEFAADHIAIGVDLITRESCAFVYGSIAVDDGDSIKLRLARDLLPGESGTEYLFGRRQAWAPTVTYMCKANVIADIPWDESLKRHQDFDFFIRMVGRVKARCNTKPTVTVHWPTGRDRDLDFASFEVFARKWVPSMSRYAAFWFCAHKVKLCLVNYKFRSAAFFLVLAIRYGGRLT